ncbi:TonB-dependent receptor plug domain-containing protein [Sphingobium lignivorans]|uniref:Outer membrane receptor protein involved in Fe transport n=1 Tax=Sphingobium lignivorans TaxID=2735886 RepID=A0ABR6NGP6_9SPHN|nr:TonB-dependent receptor [Sphingobium lignivorans]MBB5986431.1 outer membrane receptor protein involved in Fe transport [Sphingobium lignivorans]
MKKSVLSLMLASATVAIPGGPAWAQDEDGAASTSSIVVTGSRIRQPGLSALSPVTTVGEEDIKLTGAMRIEDVVNTLPAFTAGQGAFIGGQATGTANANLRNLGSTRTLVLIDGKRLMPGSPMALVPDLNFIPGNMIRRVDVVTGGASAVYGSDAVAGVVNFIMDRRFEGVQISAQHSFYQHNNRDSIVAPLARAAGYDVPTGSVTDGHGLDLSAKIGINLEGGRGNITVYGGYRKLDASFQGNRDYVACALGATGPTGSTHACLGSSTTSPARFVLNSGSGAEVTLDPAGEGNSFRPYNVLRDSYNYTPINYFQRPDRRYTMGAFASYEVSKAFVPYLDVMYMDDRTVAQLAPSGIFGQIFQINCNNPLLSASQMSAICGAASGTSATRGVSIGKRNVEGGGRLDDLRHQSYRIVAGARGDLGDAWSYDVYGQFGLTTLTEMFQRDFALSRIGRALNVVTDTRPGSATFGSPVCAAVLNGVDPNCVPYNVWSVNGVTPQAVNYLQIAAFWTGDTKEKVAGLSFSGDLGKYGVQLPWAENGVSVALGAEYREESLSSRFDETFRNGELAGQNGSRRVNMDGKFDVFELFGEANVPIVEERPLFHSLSLNMGYRFSEYSTAGSTHTFKIGGDWAPSRDIRFRAGYNKAVRAPNVSELFSPLGAPGFTGTDPCAGPAVDGRVNGYTFAQCAASGVTQAQFGTIIANPAGQYNSRTGGNPGLRPETAYTWTAGFVATPTFLPGLSITADYFNIRVEDTIDVIGGNLILRQCVQTADPFYCDLVLRSPVNGSIYLGNDGYVLDIRRNTGSKSTSGIDLSVDYRLALDEVGLGNVGSLSMSFNGTWLGSLKTEPLPGLGTYECKGYFGLTCGVPSPEWRHRARLVWATPWVGDFSLNWRYIGAVTVDRASSDPLLTGRVAEVDRRVGDRHYFDLAYSTNVAGQFNLRAGVNNLFDKAPPLISTSSLTGVLGNGNTYPQVYDPLGRYIYVGATVTF